jgi:hypothetical protein
MDSSTTIQTYILICMPRVGRSPSDRRESCVGYRLPARSSTGAGPGLRRSRIDRSLRSMAEHRRVGDPGNDSRKPKPMQHAFLADSGESKVSVRLRHIFTLASRSWPVSRLDANGQQGTSPTPMHGLMPSGWRIMGANLLADMVVTNAPSHSRCAACSTDFRLLAKHGLARC